MIEYIVVIVVGLAASVLLLYLGSTADSRIDKDDYSGASIFFAIAWALAIGSGVLVVKVIMILIVNYALI